MHGAPSFLCDTRQTVPEVMVHGHLSSDIRGTNLPTRVPLRLDSDPLANLLLTSILNTLTGMRYYRIRQ